jgi:hypothetical protein
MTRLNLQPSHTTNSYLYSMKSEILRPLQPSLAKFFAAVALTALFLTKSTIALADPASELAAFSVFDTIDVNDLAKSDVKTLHGPPMSGRFLSVQSCYVVPGAPAQHADALKKWNPTRHPELKVFLHSDLPSSPSAASFSKLKNAPDNSAARSLVEATQKLSNELQISKEEAKKFPAGGESGGGAMPGPVAQFWSTVLSGRASSFARGGSASQPPYDHTGEAIRPNEEINSLLRQQDKVRKQFSGFLGQTGIGHGAGSFSPELYWE